MRLQEKKPANELERDYLYVFTKVGRRYREKIAVETSWNLCMESLFELMKGDESPSPKVLMLRCQSRHRDYWRALKRLQKHDHYYRPRRKGLNVEENAIYNDMLDVFRKREPILFIVVLMRRDGYTREEIAEYLTNLLGLHYDVRRISDLFEEALAKIAEIAR